MKHRWSLNGKAIVASQLGDYLHAQRDHYAATTLIAGPDPRPGRPPIPIDGHELVTDHIAQGISAACAMASTFVADTRLHVTVRGWLRTRPRSDEVGSELTVSMTVAEAVEPEPFGIGEPGELAR